MLPILVLLMSCSTGDPAGQKYLVGKAMGQWLSTRGESALYWGMWQCLKTFLVFTTGAGKEGRSRGGLLLTSSGSKPGMMLNIPQHTAYSMKNSPAQNVYSTGGEESERHEQGNAGSNKGTLRKVYLLCLFGKGDER